MPTWNPVAKSTEWVHQNIKNNYFIVCIIITRQANFFFFFSSSEDFFFFTAFREKGRDRNIDTHPDQGPTPGSGVWGSYVFRLGVTGAHAGTGNHTCNLLVMGRS